MSFVPLQKMMEMARKFRRAAPAGGGAGLPVAGSEGVESIPWMPGLGGGGGPGASGGGAADVPAAGAEGEGMAWYRIIVKVKYPAGVALASGSVMSKVVSGNAESDVRADQHSSQQTDAEGFRTAVFVSKPQPVP